MLSMVRNNSYILITYFVAYPVRKKNTHSNTKNYSMLKKYLIHNTTIPDENKFSAVRHKNSKKDGTPAAYSISGAENNSIDSKQFDNSVMSNRSHLDKSQTLQTPRTGVSRKLKALDSKKSNLTTQSFRQ